MEFNPELKHPFSMLIAGPSQAGKTVFVKRLIENVNALFTVPPDEIIWAFTEYQPGYNSLLQIPNLKLVEGLPDFKELKGNPQSKKLVILDDMIELCGELTTLFTKGCHHWNLSCINIVQNIFYKSLRTARINAHYLVLFKSPSDKSQISSLARQLYPNRCRIFLDAYADATSTPYNYLLVDLTQTTPENYRLRTNIFPGEYQVVYVPKSNGL